MSEDILIRAGTRHLSWFEQLLIDAGQSDTRAICDSAMKTLKGMSGAFPYSNPLQIRWYESLRKHGVPDFSVYSDPHYLAEVWACWSVYSRAYLREIQKPQSMNPSGVAAEIRGHGAVVDVGNGIGLSTAGLKQIFPEANVFGTNIRDSAQWKVAEVMKLRAGFEMVEDFSEITEPVGLVFASEYFEHFEHPIVHLEEVVERLRPRAFLIANAFSADAIGHFDMYRHRNIELGKQTVGRMFNKRLGQLGYAKLQTCLWNNRPSFWVRTNL